MGASSGDLRQTLGNRAVNRTQVSRTTAERKGVNFPFNATVIFVSCLLYQFLGFSILSSLGLWIIPLLSPDLFWIFDWIGSGRVPASITGVGYSEEQPFWEEWEMSLRR